MAYVNGIRALAFKSSNHNKYKKRSFIEKWEHVLTLAEQALGLLRGAAEIANDQQYNEAGPLAKDWLNKLKQRSVVFNL